MSHQANLYSQVDNLLEQTKRFADRKEGEVVSDYWKHGIPDDPRLSDYKPTGYEKLDTLVRALNPRILYGAATANNSVVGAVMYQDAREKLDDDHHYIEMPNPEDFVDMDKYAAVLTHELVHWAAIRDPSIPLSGLAIPLNLYVAAFGHMPEDYTMDEMVADIGASLLLSWAGAPVPEEMPERIYASSTHLHPKTRADNIATVRLRAAHVVGEMLDKVE